MDVSDSLLVAMMFVVVLTMGIGNILTALAELADRRTSVTSDILPLTWAILLLGQHLNLFWDILEILSVKEWSFVDFVYILSGPIVLFLATSILLPKADSESKSASRAHYFRIARQFFLLLAAVMAWVLGADIFIGAGLRASAIWNLLSMFILVTLALVPRPRVHMIGTTLYAVVFPTVWVLRGFGAIP